MNRLLGALTVAAATTISLAGAVDPPPPWAFGFATPAPPGGVEPAGVGSDESRGDGASSPEDAILRHLPGSDRAFTLVRLRDPFNVADWYPGDHPVMPDIVAHGRAPVIRACGFCHYPTGQGRPENAAIAGLPYEYVVQQLADFKADNRRSSDPRKNDTKIMIDIAKALTADEVKVAATYFSSIPFTPGVTVQETTIVFETRLANGWFVSAGFLGKIEPIGDRIVEVPEKTDNTEKLRDPRAAFFAGVPLGSLERGEQLVVNGGKGKTTKCSMCHGADLRGAERVPGIAGRSPSYIVRQLYDMHSGARNGRWTDQMKPVVARLTTDDMLAIAAYAASRTP